MAVSVAPVFLHIPVFHQLSDKNSYSLSEENNNPEPSAPETRVSNFTSIKLTRKLTTDLLNDLESLRGLECPSHLVSYGTFHATERDIAVDIVVPNLEDTRSLNDELLNKKSDSQILGRYFQDILHGLQYLHDQNIYHGDLSPRNILVTSSNARLTSWGLVQALTNHTYPAPMRSSRATYPTWGSRFYTAPETLTQRDIGPSADVFGFGVLLLGALSQNVVLEAPGSSLAAACTLRYKEQVPLAESSAHEIEELISAQDRKACRILRACLQLPAADRAPVARLLTVLAAVPLFTLKQPSSTARSAAWKRLQERIVNAAADDS